MTLPPRVGTALLIIGVGVLATVLLVPGHSVTGRTRTAARPAIGASRATATDRVTLSKTIKALQAHLADQPDDLASAESLADALLRQARITANGGLAIDAERALRTALRDAPGDYDGRRMLCAVLLSEHRFKEAADLASALQRERPDDAWSSGVIGDASLELGAYDRAFAAFQRMIDTRPTAAAYARVSYARELQGDLEGALDMMRQSAQATSPEDVESLAWHQAQIGNLLLQMGRLDAARRAFERSAFYFPGHPFATLGLVRTRAATGDTEGALREASAALAAAPSLPLAAAAGDLASQLGRDDEASRDYAIAEQIARETVQSEGTLARFLAERGRRTGEALALARQLARGRDDIFTDDLLAWACYQSGRLADALDASARSLRTGTRNPEILAHAAAIRAAHGDTDEARRLLREAIASGASVDPLLRPLTIDVGARVAHAVERARNAR